MKKAMLKKIKSLALLFAWLLLTCSMRSYAVQPNVVLPGGLNLGGTSFYDGFGGGPGDSALQVYLVANHYKGLKDGKGNDVPAFNSPKLDVYTMVNQYSYLFPTDARVLGGHLGLDAIVPLVKLDAEFGQAPPFPGIQLRDNGFGMGDPTLSVFVQHDPVMINGNPFFASRMNIGVTAPWGKYDEHRDFNPGNNFWSVHAYWAMTFLLGPKWSISLRPNYYYNFKNTKPASSLPLDEGVKDTQAGQSAHINYNMAYKLSDRFSIGVGGYYLKQVSDDRVDGNNIKDSREQVFAFGPGFFYNNNENKFYLTAYRESNVEDRFEAKSSVVLRWLRTF